MSQPDLRVVQSTADYANGPDGTALETALELMAEEYALLERDAESLGIAQPRIATPYGAPDRERERPALPAGPLKNTPRPIRD